VSPEPVTAERIYRRLKLDVISGRFRPGSLVISQLISKEYGNSITPVRDAMQRLVGERLLEHHEGGGFEIPQLSADGLRDLYIWHGQVLRLAVKQGQPAANVEDMLDRLEELDPEDSFAISQTTAELFSRVASASNNAEHAVAIAAIGDRLFAPRTHEGILKERKVELIAVWNAIISGQDSTVREAIWAYHRRRIRRVPMLLKSLYSR
jgi:DNA-binding GntR family transcriptional regulator